MDKFPYSSKNKEEESIPEETRRGSEIICNCTRSKCLKKYCECYKAGIKCKENCRCRDCKNGYPNILLMDNTMDYNDYEDRFISNKADKQEEKTAKSKHFITKDKIMNVKASLIKQVGSSVKEESSFSSEEYQTSVKPNTFIKRLKFEDIPKEELYPEIFHIESINISIMNNVISIVKTNSIPITPNPIPAYKMNQQHNNFNELNKNNENRNKFEESDFNFNTNDILLHNSGSKKLSNNPDFIVLKKLSNKTYCIENNSSYA